MDDYTQNLVTTITTLSSLLADKNNEAHIAQVSLLNLQEAHGALQEDHQRLKSDMDTQKRQNVTIEHVQNTKDNLHRQLNTTMQLFAHPDLMLSLTNYMNGPGRSMYDGEKIRLIKNVLDLTKPIHWGLKQAKDFVESYPWTHLEAAVPSLPPIGELLIPPTHGECEACDSAAEEELSRGGDIVDEPTETVGDGDPSYESTIPSPACIPDPAYRSFGG